MGQVSETVAQMSGTAATFLANQGVQKWEQLWKGERRLKEGY